jgi:hypothetical protein
MYVCRSLSLLWYTASFRLIISILRRRAHSRQRSPSLSNQGCSGWTAEPQQMQTFQGRIAFADEIMANPPFSD